VDGRPGSPRQSHSSTSPTPSKTASHFSHHRACQRSISNLQSPVTKNFDAKVQSGKEKKKSLCAF
jgi:hypothetical protein